MVDLTTSVAPPALRRAVAGRLRFLFTLGYVLGAGLVAVARGARLTTIMASRLASGMAEERLLTAPFSRVLPGRRALIVAIMAVGLVLYVVTRRVEATR